MQDKFVLGRYYRGWALLFQTSHTIRQVAARMFRPLGISPLELVALLIIKRSIRPIRPIDLAQLLLRKRTSMSALVNTLQKKGLVRKVKDLDRRNLVRIELTEKGEAVFRQAYDVSVKDKAIYRILRAVSDEQYQQLMSSLEILLEKALEELGVDYELPFE
jgi:MarR family multiple antibiotic resistance transcriptional regulator